MGQWSCLLFWLEEIDSNVIHSDGHDPRRPASGQHRGAEAGRGEGGQAEVQRGRVGVGDHGRGACNHELLSAGLQEQRVHGDGEVLDVQGGADHEGVICGHSRGGEVYGGGAECGGHRSAWHSDLAGCGPGHVRLLAG